jgi:hypothetical protein
MKDDLPYDAIPNFTAADALRVVGVGRNEYISTVVQAKSKKFMWIMNIKGVIKDLLPSEPLPPRPAPWWIVNLVNLTETEYRSINTPKISQESIVCEAAARPGGVCYDAVDRSVVESLHRRGLVWFDVPIAPDDHISILTLEGFVSNKSTGTQNETDPLESLLYKVFVAASDGVDVGELAGILGVSIESLLIAISIACRLEYCTKLDFSDVRDGRRIGLAELPKETQHSLPVLGPGITISAAELEAVLSRHSIDAEVQAGHHHKPGSPTAQHPGPSPSPKTGKADFRELSSTRGIAVVVDAEVTGFLMMGALTPGVKKHAVTLFEGGRIHGNSVIDELLQELRVSTSMAASFEGEMAHLGKSAESLAQILECVRRNADDSNRPIEILRKESLEEPSIDPSAAFRILKHSYAILIPVTTLSPPPLPIPPHLSQEGLVPTHYGPVLAATSPWLNVAVFQACSSPGGGKGVKAFVIPAATRISTVSCNGLLRKGVSPSSIIALWPWDPKFPKRGGGGSSSLQDPVLVKGATFLYTLNQLLTSCAVLVQPLLIQDDGEGEISMDSDVIACSLVDLPLPFSALMTSTSISTTASDSVKAQNQKSTVTIQGYNRKDGACVDLEVPWNWVQALQGLGMEQCVGVFTVLRNVGTHGNGGPLTPWSVRFGIPLTPVALCSAVCRAAEKNNFLNVEACTKHAQGQEVLLGVLRKLQTTFGGGPLRVSNIEPSSETSSDAKRPIIDAVASPIHPLTIDAAGSVCIYDLGCAVQGS